MNFDIAGKEIKLIIFDLDGTLLDTLGDLTEAVNYAMDSLHFPEHSLEEVRSFVGNGNKKLMERSVPKGTSPEITEQSLWLFHEYYGTHFAVKTVAYEGITDLLSALKARGYQLAVVSNKADYAVQKICHTYFEGIFDAALGDREGIRKKPDPDPVFYVLDMLSVPAAQAIYVGDSEVDIQTAANAKLPCISVDWGFRPHNFLQSSGAAKIISRPLQLLDILSASF